MHFFVTIIAMFLRCCYRRFCLPPPFFPPDLLLTKHWMLNSVLFLFSTVLFSRFLFFYSKIYMSLFLLLVVGAFCVLLFRLVSCVPCLFFALFFVLASNWSKLGDIYFSYNIFSLFACFLAGLLCFFLVCCFLTVAIRDKYRRPGPCEHPHAFFAWPPILNWPNRLAWLLGCLVTYLLVAWLVTWLVGHLLGYY